MSESTKVTKSTIIHGRRQNFFRGGGQRRHHCWRSVFPLRYFCTEQILVLVSIIILGLSKWNFQWITNFVNYMINTQSYQNTNKITFHSNSFLFARFSIALEYCKCARMRFHCATVLVVLSICALRGNIADDAMQMDVHKTLYPCYTTTEMLP